MFCFFAPYAWSNEIKRNKKNYLGKSLTQQCNRVEILFVITTKAITAQKEDERKAAMQNS